MSSDDDDNDIFADDDKDEDVLKDGDSEGEPEGDLDDEEDVLVHDDDDDEEEVEENEEEEDEEDEEEDEPRAKKRRRKVNRFIEEEAAVDDEDEEEEDEAEEGFVEDREEDLEEVQKHMDTRAHRELDRQRDERDMDAELIAQRMKERYGRADHGRGTYRGDLDHIPQSMLMPSVNDPKLYLCQVREGKEKDIVFSVMRRAFERENTANPLQVFSVFARDSLRGYIYLEAITQGAVQQALDGINNVFISKLRLVPIDEMVDTLTIKAKSGELKEKKWVRAKKGKYAGDLGQVIAQDDTGELILCRFIPRLDPAKDNTKPAFGQKRKKNEPRPPAKLFNPADFKGEVRKEKDYWIYNNEYFDRQGFLEKNLKATSLITDNVQPTLEEMQRFSGVVDERDLDLSEIASTNVATGDNFQIGETVEVATGAMTGISGKIVSIQQNNITIKPEGGLGDLPTVNVPAQEVRKKFNEGDHVKVMNGLHKDQAGLIIAIKGNIVTLLSDSTMKPIDVFSKDLRAAADVANTAKRISPYDVGDLVYLSNNDVAVVTKVEADVLTVLTQYNQTQKVQPTQIRGKRDSARAVTSDANGNPISNGKSVDINDFSMPENKRRGTVLHIFRAFVFVKLNDVSENAGIVVTKAQNVVAVGMQPSGQSFGPYGARNGYGGGRGGGFGSTGGFYGRGGSGRGRGRGGRDPLVGRSVTISGGPHKGYLGIVKEVVDNTARVELHTANRVVSVDRSKLMMHGEGAGMAGPAAYDSGRMYNQYDNGSNYGRRSPQYGGRTPMVGGRTPMAGGKTPMAGGRTPAWEAGSRTPAYEMGSRSSAWDAGSKTPAYESSSRSAAWDAGSKTPHHDYGGRSAAWDSGSRTPGPDRPVSSGLKNDYDARSEWVAPRLIVKIKPSSQIGTVTTVQLSTRTATIKLQSGETRTESYDNLQPVRPTAKEDRVLILDGGNKGKMATLISVAETDGIVRLDGTSKPVIAQMEMLGKMEK